ncbi:MAG: LAGLIDADG family homing endonuclease, partial [Candidatus Odinarchaeota archaeon]
MVDGSRSRRKINNIMNHCLAGSTKIFLKNGKITTIADLVDAIKSGNLDLKDVHVATLDMYYRMAYRPVIDVQKIPSPSMLLYIKTRSGGEISVTRDHKILVDAPQGPKMVPAEELEIGQEIFSSNRIDIDVNVDGLPSLLELFLKTPENPFVTFSDKDVSIGINKAIKNEFGDLKVACQELDIKYSRITDSYHKRRYTIDELERLGEEFSWGVEHWKLLSSKTSLVGVGRRRTDLAEDFNLYTRDFFYILGFVASDGTVGIYEKTDQNGNIKGYTYKFGFDNSIKSVVENTRDLVQKYIPDFNPKLKQNQDGVWMCETSNLFLMRLVEVFGAKGRVKDEESYHPIFRLPENLIAGFLQGYFDGDGTVILREKRIGLTVGKLPWSRAPDYDPEQTRHRAKNLQLLLKRLGI